MTESSENKIWKIRTIKSYPEATNHLLVGRVLAITDSYVRLHSRTYHFNRPVAKPEDMQIGDVMVRVVPWSRIEIINELPENFDYIRSSLIADTEGQVLFQDGKHAFPMGSIPATCKCEVRY